MSKYGNVKFRKEVKKAYDILWKMYRSDSKGGEKDGEGACEWDLEQEKKLHAMLNAIDDITDLGD